MRTIVVILLFILISCSPSVPEDVHRLEQHAERVVIIRDKWGVPHIYGKTDADAVFGLMYAQCEESFERVERNYLRVLGRLAEVEGESYFYHDLAMKVLYDTAVAIADYKKSPAWLKALLDAFADGVNYYLYKNPQVKPLIINRFEPWFPLLFTDGAYISTNLGGLQFEDIKGMYGTDNSISSLQTGECLNNPETQGSNAFALAPSRTDSGNAMLYINPHVSFYFRTEVHLNSEEGLNAYGAVTWGQFFVYQGFNEHCGWMHTSSAADAADVYEEKISRQGSQFVYEFDGAIKPVSEKKVSVVYRSRGRTSEHQVNVYYTHHGPVLANRNGKWLSLRSHPHSMNGLIQSWLRMKARSLPEFITALDLRANSSTNTMYADADGNIAYWHGNFVPKRSTQFDFSKKVDGSTSKTEWQGAHSLDELVHSINPPAGYLQNCNTTPFSVAGYGSIDAAKFPVYLAPEEENFRSVRAISELGKGHRFSIDKLIALGYDPYLPVFDTLLPPLFDAYNQLPAANELKATLAEAVEELKMWDRRPSVTSTTTALAVFWAYEMMLATTPPENGSQVDLVRLSVSNTSSQKKLELLQGVLNGLRNAYGNWRIEWGVINRFQRTGKSDEQFDDSKESFPVGLASATLGCLPSWEVTRTENNKFYGTAGNSFVAAVEFYKKAIDGKRIRARSVVTGGQFFDPASRHFTDQARMFLEGKFKEVSFYRRDVEANRESKYHPGEKH